MSVGFVVGYKYETRVYGISASGYDSFNIFIPSLNLNISDHGYVSRTTRPYGSLKSQLVTDQYLHKCNREGLKFDREELKKLQEVADISSKEEVQVPEELAHGMDALLQEQEKLEAQRKDLEKRVNTFARQFFEKT